MPGVDSVHHRFVARGNALAERFEGAATLVAKAHGQAVEGRLVQLLQTIRNTPGDPFKSPAIQTAVGDFFQDVEQLGLQLFGEGSVFEEQTVVVMNSMARNGMERLIAEGRAQGFVLEQTLMDADAILAAARSGYELAARNLATVEPLQRLITQELIQGNGTVALAKKLADEGYLVNGQRVPWLKDLVRGGRTYTVAQRAAMMARTEPRRLQEWAYQLGTKDVEPNPQDRLYRWVSVLAPTSTQDSLDRHGHIMSKAEWEKQVWPNDNYVGLPPLRPNDRCSVIFYRREWLNQEGQQAISQPPGSEGRRVLPPGQKKLLQQLQEARKQKAAPRILVKPKPAPKPAPKPRARPAPPRKRGQVVPPMARTVEEAVAWARKSGAVKGPVQYEGLTLDAANEVNRWLADRILNDKMPPLKQLVTGGTRAYADYTYGQQRLRIGHICFNTASLEANLARDMQHYVGAAKKARADLPKWQASVKKLTDEIRDVTRQRNRLPKGPERNQLTEALKLMRKDLRYNQKILDSLETAALKTRWNTAQRLTDMLNHEYGHHLHGLMPGDRKLAQRLLDELDLSKTPMREQWSVRNLKEAVVGGGEGAQRALGIAAEQFKGTGYGYDRLGGVWKKGEWPTFENLFSNRGKLSRVGEAKAARVSAYATTNTHEHFAEAYAAYLNGETLLPEVKAVVEEVIANGKRMGKGG